MDCAYRHGKSRFQPGGRGVDTPQTPSVLSVDLGPDDQGTASPPPPPPPPGDTASKSPKSPSPTVIQLPGPPTPYPRDCDFRRESPAESPPGTRGRTHATPPTRPHKAWDTHVGATEIVPLDADTSQNVFDIQRASPRDFHRRTQEGKFRGSNFARPVLGRGVGQSRARSVPVRSPRSDAVSRRHTKSARESLSQIISCSFLCFV